MKVTLPSGAKSMHFLKRKPSRAVCANCKKELSGVPAELPKKLKTMPKTKKRPERPYGGVLCPSCMREAFKEKARSAVQLASN